MSTSQVPCSHCSKSYDIFNTAHGKPSKLCPQCRETQKRADEKRKDRVRNYQAEAKRNLDVHWESFKKKSVAVREKENTLTKEDFLELIQKCCFYCTYLNEEEVNGIDRIDNAKGYSKENCVSACKVCNRMKHILHPVFFIEKARLIAKFQEQTLTDKERGIFYSKWNEYVHKSPVPYIYVKRNSEEKRQIAYTITKEQYEELIYTPCYLCGFKCHAGNGLDRIDNTKREYTSENVLPCCSTCNMMKAFFTREEFQNKMKEISEKCKIPESWIEIPRHGFHMGGAKTEKETETEEKDKQWRAKTIYKGILSDTLEPFIKKTIESTGWTRAIFLEETNTIFEKTKKSTFNEVELDLKKLVQRINGVRNHLPK